MSNKTKLPKEVVQEIKEQAEKAYDIIGDAVENRNDDFRLPSFRKETSPIEEVITTYATKLHEAQQENKKLKAIADLWRPLMEEAIRQDSLYGHVPIETINKIKRFLYGE